MGLHGCFPFGYKNKKGSLMHIAPAYAGFGEGSNYFGSYVHSLSLHFCKRLLELEPMTSWSQGNSFTTAPGLPFSLMVIRIWMEFLAC
jgi:hypothetical protein